MTTYKQRFKEQLIRLGFTDPVPRPTQLLGRVNDAEFYNEHSGMVTAIVNGVDRQEWSRRTGNMIGTVVVASNRGTPGLTEIIRKSIDSDLAGRGLQVAEVTKDDKAMETMRRLVNPIDSFLDADLRETMVQVIGSNGEYSVVLNQYIQKGEDNLLVTATRHAVVVAVKPMIDSQVINQLSRVVSIMLSNYGEVTQVTSIQGRFSFVTYLDSVLVQGITARLLSQQYNLSSGIGHAYAAYRNRVMSAFAGDPDFIPDTELYEALGVQIDQHLFQITVSIMDAVIIQGAMVAMANGLNLVKAVKPAVAKEAAPEAANV